MKMMMNMMNDNEDDEDIQIYRLIKCLLFRIKYTSFKKKKG